jgi:hypothetical protein
LAEVEEKDKRKRREGRKRAKEKEKMENFPNLEILGEKHKRQLIDLI